MTYRDRFRPVIAQVLAEHAGAELRELRKALRDAWDAHGGGPRAYWPYKVWLDEIKVQRERLARFDAAQTTARRRRKVRSMTAEEAREWMAKRQLPLPLEVQPDA